MDPAQARLLVTVAGITPGSPLDAAARLADALDARRVPLTLLLAPGPHPEVAAWASARRRVGDAVLLHGTAATAEHGAPFRRLPAHEAGLRLAGALRRVDAAGGPAVDGFAAPGWAVSTGTREALGRAGLDLLVDDRGVHRLGRDAGSVVSAGRRGRRRDGVGSGVLRHLAVDLITEARTATWRAVDRAVEKALDAGAVPVAATGVLPPAPLPASRRSDRRTDGDPELWSITA